MALCLNETQDNCSSCIKFDTDNNPDFNVISPDGNSIKIEQIRLMQSKVIEKPIVSNKKVYIIDEANCMTKEAQNCLLKTLEEPPEYVIIILICNNENELLTTIKSRCTKIEFSKIDEETLKNYINENKILENANKNILKACNGSIGRAYNLKANIEAFSQIESSLQDIHKKDKIDFVKSFNILYEKDSTIVLDLLDYVNIIFIKNAKHDLCYINCINYVEEAKKRLKQNSNLNMTIDDMLFSIWGEINEKYNRS